MNKPNKYLGLKQSEGNSQELIQTIEYFYPLLTDQKENKEK